MAKGKISFTVAVKDLNKINEIANNRRGQAQITAQAILAATKDGKLTVSKDAIVDAAAPQIDEYDLARTKGQGGQQGGAYCARYYISLFGKEGSLDVTRVTAEAPAPAADAKPAKKSKAA